MIEGTKTLFADAAARRILDALALARTREPPEKRAIFDDAALAVAEMQTALLEAASE